jgi:hypothetical protein
MYFLKHKNYILFNSIIKLIVRVIFISLYSLIVLR